MSITISANSLPANFAFPTPLSGTLPFTIPAGVYSAAFVTLAFTLSDFAFNSHIFTVGGNTGSLVSPGVVTGYIVTGTAPLMIAAVNTAAGGIYNCPISVSSSSTVGVVFTSATLTLTPVPSTVTTFSITAGASDVNGCALGTLTLLDNTGSPIVAPSGGQVFALTDVSGVLTPTSVTVLEGSSTAMFQYCNSPSGTYVVTATPGAGPLTGTAAKTANFVIVAPGAGDTATTPSLCILQFTRANMRDAIRRKLGLTPPIDQLPGIAAAGEEPAGESYPSNSVLNQAIADAIRYINRETGFHTSVALTVNVPVTASNGVQFLPMQGIGAGPYQNLINTVQRAIFYSNTGTVAYRLLPVTFNALDRDMVQYDNYVSTPIPQQFFIEGYQIGILPGASMGGTLQLYAGTGLLGFCSDTDTLDEIPIDYQAVIEDVAVALVSMYSPTDDGAKDHTQMFTQLGIVQGIKQIKRWQVMINSQQQPRFTATSHRRYRWV